jgi:hypothetical protein
MRKLSLDLDHLQVQSFDTMPAAPGARGAVLARQGETYDEIACAGPTCAPCACTQTICDPTDTADPNRRIILY